MTPIFDAKVRLVGFFDGTHLFDTDNGWMAFHDRENVFAPSGRWLGPLKDGSFLDADGRPVAWLAGARPTAGLKPHPPMNPKRPLPPRRPLRPRTPLPPQAPMPPGGGWSALTWAQWLGHEPAAARIDVDRLAIEPITPDGLAAFFDYLGEQLAENGRGGRWFQPMATTTAGVPEVARTALRTGFGVPDGAPGWRRGWIARDAQGRVAGHVDLRAHASEFAAHRCELGMGVRRDLRRLGLASRLLAHASAWAGAQGLRWIDLRVLSSNEPAVALYRREGFQVQGGRPDMFVIDGQSLGELWMARKVQAGDPVSPSR